MKQVFQYDLESSQSECGAVHGGRYAPTRRMVNRFHLLELFWSQCGAVHRGRCAPSRRNPQEPTQDTMRYPQPAAQEATCHL